MTETEAYLSIEKLLAHVARRYALTHPELDVDELIGEGQAVALAAIRSYNGRSKMSTWVGRCLWTHYHNHTRYTAWRQRVARKSHLDLAHDVVAKSLFNLQRLMWEVSEPASEVLRLVCFAGHRKASLLKALRQMQWSQEQIDRVFQEIREVL